MKNLYRYIVGESVRELLSGHIPEQIKYAYFEKKNGVFSFFDTCGFTIDALALDEKGVLHHHPLALHDWRNNILRPTSVTTFIDVPRRVFMVARLMAQNFRLRLAPEAEEQLAGMTSKDLDAIPAEHVREELCLALAGRAPGRFLRTLETYGCLSPWFSELEQATRIAAGPVRRHGTRTVFWHICDVMDRCTGDPLAAWMALCHDLGKIHTSPDGWPHHYGHEELGLPVARTLSRRLKLSKRYLRAAETACIEHMRAGRFGNMRAGKRRDLLWKLDKLGFAASFWRMVAGDSGHDWQSQAERETRILRSVHLPEGRRGKGERSGIWFRDLQCSELKRISGY